MKNYTKTNVQEQPRTELHETLKLTGSEISINHLEAGSKIPFIHAHRNNEEVYGILSGKGKVIIDDEEIELQKGDWLKIAPKAKRQFFAANDIEFSFVCIQTKENSLDQFTVDDMIIY